MSVRELLTQSSRRFAMTFAEREGLDMDEVGKELDSYMDRHYQFDVRPKRGIEDVFRTLKQNGAKLCVATAAPREICYRAMEKFGFLQ